MRLSILSTGNEHREILPAKFLRPCTGVFAEFSQSPAPDAHGYCISRAEQLGCINAIRRAEYFIASKSPSRDN